LRRESGFTYDLGAEFTVGREGRYTLHGEASWFDSRIDDWIAWLPTLSNGIWTPINVHQVHAYGVELSGALDVRLGGDWRLDINGNFSWTPSIDLGDPVSPNDISRGKQLVYIPEYSASATGRLSFRTWSFDYNWCWYSERFTTTSNTVTTQYERVLPYYISDIALEKRFVVRWADLSVKCAVRNLFNEEYESVLSHPMPGTNFEIFIGITPKW
jgi:iron complex outermembrane receptor protein